MGEDARTTRFTDRWPATFGGGTFESATLAVYADDVSLENVTVENAYGLGIQTLAVAVCGRRVQFRNFRFLGWQDTVRIDNGPMYFVSCHIEGHCDYIYGSTATRVTHLKADLVVDETTVLTVTHVEGYAEIHWLSLVEKWIADGA